MRFCVFVEKKECSRVPLHQHGQNETRGSFSTCFHLQFQVQALPDYRLGC